MPQATINEITQIAQALAILVVSGATGTVVVLKVIMPYLARKHDERDPAREPEAAGKKTPEYWQHTFRTIFRNVQDESVSAIMSALDNHTRLLERLDAKIDDGNRDTVALLGQNTEIIRQRLHELSNHIHELRLRGRP